jgi:hypothetical protein
MGGGGNDGTVLYEFLASAENTAVGMSHWPRDTLYVQKLPLTSPTRGGR